MVATTPLADYIRARMAELDIDSNSALARRAGLAPETVRRILTGVGQPSETTLKKIAGAIGGSVARMRLLSGRPAGEHTPFVLPPEANQLGARERQVVLAMVRALLHASGRANHGDGVTDMEVGMSDSPPSVPRLVSRLRDTDGAV